MSGGLAGIQWNCDVPDKKAGKMSDVPGPRARAGGRVAARAGLRGPEGLQNPYGMFHSSACFLTHYGWNKPLGMTDRTVSCGGKCPCNAPNRGKIPPTLLHFNKASYQNPYATMLFPFASQTRKQIFEVPFN